jgi:3-oxoacyl-[acyl-carrier protein] reductase
VEISCSGRVALVTGASRGIGRAAAIALAEAGADVAVNYRSDEEGARDTVAAIQKLGRNAIKYAAAVENYEENERMVAAVVRDFGSIGILVSNAGASSNAAPVAEGELAEFDHVMRVNAFAPYFLAKLAIPHLRQHKRSDVIVVSSVATLNLRPNTAAYTMSKAAAEALIQVLAKEERRHGVRCNIVAPGLTDTVMGQKGAEIIFGTKNIRELDASQPFGHVCQPEEVASAIVYLVSEANSYVSGQKLYVNGGG